MYFTLPAQRGSHIQPPPTSSPAAAVLGEIILTLWLQKITQKISGMHQPGTSSPSQAHICWQATTLCCRMLSRVTCNATCHMDHCSVAPFCKDAHRQDLQEAGIVSALSVVISAQVCISNGFFLFFFFCMLKLGRNKLFSDYRDLSYMHIILRYTMCLITNILEIADFSSGKTNYFL